MRSTFHMCRTSLSKSYVVRFSSIIVLAILAGCTNSVDQEHSHDKNNEIVQNMVGAVPVDRCSAKSDLLAKIGAKEWLVDELNAGVPKQDYDEQSKFYFHYDSNDGKITGVSYDRYKNGYEGKKDRGAADICSKNFGVNGVRISFSFGQNEHLHQATFTFSELNKRRSAFEYRIDDGDIDLGGANDHGKGKGFGT